MTPSDFDTLLTELTLDEKILLLAGKNFWETHEINRLNIPSLKVTDGPNGARGAQILDGVPATCFPACVSLASTFDRELAYRIGKALGEETQTKGAYVLLGPTVCVHRSPVGGRNFEAFSEDPLLAGTLASQYVLGLQSERVAATVKHFFANEQETRRFVVDEIIPERAIREIYLKPFKIVVKEADPWCIMTAYNKVNGHYIDATPRWLTNVLRHEWGWEGLAMTDWGAGSCVESVRNGLDLEMPGPARVRASDLVHEALKDGRISESDIDNRVRRFLQLLERVGKFSDRKTTPDERAIDKPEHRALIREAGAAGIVMLQNLGNILPIDVANVKRIAVLGPLADVPSGHGGGSASMTCHYKVSPAEALASRLGDRVEFVYSKGAHIYRALPDLLAGVTTTSGSAGFLIEYFENHHLQGQPFETQFTTRSYFTTLDQIEIKPCAMSARMTTTFRPKEAGSHYLSLSGTGPTKLFINNDLVLEQTGNVRDAMAFIIGGQDELRVQYPFEAGKAYELRIEITMPDTTIADIYILDKQLSVHLGFVPQAEMDQALLSEAAELARTSDIALVFTGNTTQWESEGQDMEAMTLPPYDTRTQDSLVEAVAAANPNTIVVNTTGSPVELPWLDNIAGFLQAWYAGQETGNAIVDVLLGDVNPSGKLPMSWPRVYEDTACYGNFGFDSQVSKRVEYVEGVFVGYRHFDRRWDTERQVLFPFGFGLSYTRFEVTHASLDGAVWESDGETTAVSVCVKNTGDRAGAEVIQVYLCAPAVAGLERPVKELASYAKVVLEPREEKVVKVGFGREAAAYWDDAADKWRVVPGQYTVLIATSSAPADVKSRLSLEIPHGFTYNP
ncbi:glycoside hydrolase superfamily [Aspergillus carlsbadensis]|nr:glycoside hydrolase superfamily [Aspergillus carlsbadensis]